MSASKIRAGQAFVETYLKGDALVKKKLGQIESKMRAMGAGMSAIGKRMAATAAVTVVAMAPVVSTFADFSAKMSEVKAITGAAPADFDRLNAKAKELGSTTSFSATQVADAMKFLGMAGFNTAQILESVPAVLNLARAGAVDLGMAADIASDVGSAFGFTADEIGRVADVIAKTATSANTSVEMMGETFKFAAPLAKAAGQSIEETATAAGILGNNGIKADMAGTDIKNLLTILSNESEIAGVKTRDAAGNIRPLLDLMQEIGAATSDLDGGDRLAFFMNQFGLISGKSAVILADAGEQIGVMRGHMDEAGGSAETMAKVMGDNLKGSFVRLMSAAEGVAIAIGEGMAPTLTIWSDKLAAVANWITNVAGENHEFIDTVLKGVAAVGAIGAALIAAGVTATAASSIFGVLSAILTGTAVTLKLVVGTVALVLSPVGLATTAVLALGAAWLTMTDSGQRALQSLTTSTGKAMAFMRDEAGFYKDVATDAFSGVKDALAAGDLGLAAKIGWQGVLIAVERVSGQIEQVWMSLKTSVLNVWDDMITGVAMQINDLIGWLRDNPGMANVVTGGTFSLIDMALPESIGSQAVNDTLAQDNVRQQQQRDSEIAKAIQVRESKQKELISQLARLNETAKKAADEARRRQSKPVDVNVNADDLKLSQRFPEIITPAVKVENQDAGAIDVDVAAVDRMDVADQGALSDPNQLILSGLLQARAAQPQAAKPMEAINNLQRGAEQLLKPLADVPALVGRLVMPENGPVAAAANAVGKAIGGMIPQDGFRKVFDMVAGVDLRGAADKVINDMLRLEEMDAPFADMPADLAALAPHRAFPGVFGDAALNPPDLRGALEPLRNAANPAAANRGEFGQDVVPFLRDMVENTGELVKAIKDRPNVFR